MRLFTAIELPPHLLLRLERLLSALRPEAQVSWSPLDNLHITTGFIGTWPEARLNEVMDGLSSLAPRQSFEVHLKEFCWFPNSRSPHVLSVGTEPCAALEQLGEDTRDCLERLGIAKEKRAYTPHLTLARIKRPVPLQRLRQKLELFEPSTFGSFEAHSFHLYRSDPGSNASIYRKLKSFGFENVLAAS
jgi:RNA 2',3'-cyclic 3'-phosphodiesterase